MAESFALMTDSSCDFPYEFYAENDIAVASLSFIVDGATYVGMQVAPNDFYKMIREGKMPTTAAINVEEHKAAMEPQLAQGKDLLYLAFSSGLSVTAQNGGIAAQELREKYPDRRIIVVDSLCASMGQGLFVYHANKLRREGKSIGEVAQWAENNRLRIAHYVMADDLMHLHRGGRVSKTSAIAGGLLGIKPVIHVDNEGKLIPIGKVRGKKQALTDLVNRMEKAVGETKYDFFTVSHADCEEDAKFVAELVSKRFKINNYMISYIGPVIGSHTGAGTVALFMMVDHR